MKLWITIFSIAAINKISLFNVKIANFEMYIGYPPLVKSFELADRSTILVITNYQHRFVWLHFNGEINISTVSGVRFFHARWSSLHVPKHKELQVRQSKRQSVVN